MVLVSVAFLLTLASAFRPLRVHADDEHDGRATDRGRKMIGGSLGAAWSNDSSDVPWPSFRTWDVYLAPDLTYFVRDGVGIGGYVGGSYGYEHSPSGAFEYAVRDVQTSFGLSALFELPLGTHTSLLAITRAGYGRRWVRLVDSEYEGDVNAPGRNIRENQTLLAFKEAIEYDTHTLRAALILPFAFHLSDAVLLGLGPDAWVEQLFGQSARNTPRTLFSVGVSSWLGYSF